MVLSKPAPAAAAVLLYGPDEGLIRERLNILAKTVVADVQDPFNVAEFSAGQILDNPAQLIDEALSLSMLGGRRVIKLRDASDKLTSIVKGVLAALKAGDNFLLLTAGELPPRSTLRALFENAENAAAIPCYVEDIYNIGRFIAETLRAAGYNIPPEAVTYMAGNVVGDRAVARSEVEKLITYVGAGQKSILLADVTACIGNSADLSLDDLAKHVASGQFGEANRILTHVLAEGIPAVTVLRNLQNHFLRLHISKVRVMQGEGVEDVLKKLRPPPFFKVKDAFVAQLLGWGLPQIEQALALLTGVEAKCKQTGSNPETLTGRAVLSLAQLGSRATGARQRA